MELNKNEREKYLIIEKVVNGEKSRNDASKELDKSLRQIDRLCKKYKEEGEKGFIHKSRGKKSNNKRIDKNIKEEIINLYINEYFDYNYSHFYEDAKIKEKYNISFVSLKTILDEADVISPLAQRKTRKEYNERMKEVIERKDSKITEEVKFVYESRRLTEEQAHTRKTSNLMKFGEEIQMDAAEYMWFGDIVSQLHLAVDRATKNVLFGWFGEQETTRNYFILLYNIVYIYGIPELIKTDQRGTFIVNNDYGDETKLTQFGMICKKLNIKLNSNSNPLHKPNVERENHTFENRLKAELRHENITTFEDANRYLNDIFIPKMNERFAYPIDSARSVMKENKYSVEELKLIISEKDERIIDNASSIQYNKKYYVPIDNDSNIVHYKHGTKCIVIVNYDYELWCKIENDYYKLKEVEKYVPTPINSVKKKSQVKKQYIPPANHPWRRGYK